MFGGDRGSSAQGAAGGVTGHSRNPGESGTGGLDGRDKCISGAARSTKKSGDVKIAGGSMGISWLEIAEHFVQVTDIAPTSFGATSTCSTARDSSTFEYNRQIVFWSRVSRPIFMIKMDRSYISEL